MAIKTIEQLEDKINHEMSWRRIEIHDLKSIAHKSKVSSIRKKVLYRIGVALLYAHWEGFIKSTGTYYLEYVSRQRLPLSQLKTNFVTLIYKKKLNESCNSNKYSILDKITDTLINDNAKKEPIPYKDVINTRSNLFSKVLKEIIWCLGIDYTPFATKEHFIDHRLVNKRNHVAHGETLDIDEDDFIEMVDEVLSLIETFKSELTNSASQGHYKK